MLSIRKGSVVFIFKTFVSVRVLRPSGNMVEALTRGFPNKKRKYWLLLSGYRIQTLPDETPFHVTPFQT